MAEVINDNDLNLTTIQSGCTYIYTLDDPSCNYRGTIVSLQFCYLTYSGSDYANENEESNVFNFITLNQTGLLQYDAIIGNTSIWAAPNCTDIDIANNGDTSKRSGILWLIQAIKNRIRGIRSFLSRLWSSDSSDPRSPLLCCASARLNTTSYFQINDATRSFGMYAVSNDSIRLLANNYSTGNHTTCKSTQQHLTCSRTHSLPLIKFGIGKYVGINICVFSHLIKI